MLYIHFPPNLTHVTTYLVKRGCSKFLPNTGCFTITLLRFGVKVKKAQATVATNFLLRGHSQDEFLCFNRTAPRRIEHATLSLSWSERDASSSKRLCPCTRCTFRG